MATSTPADRGYLLYTLPALAVVTPFLAFAALLAGVGPTPALVRIVMTFLIVAPATGLLGLRTLARVGSAAPDWVHRRARLWCYLTFVTPVVLYLGMRWLAERVAR